MNKILLLLSLIFFVATSAFADPISKEEADAWVNHVRKIMKWSQDFDVRKEAEQRKEQAELHLNLFPTSKEYRRDLADALHTLGHFAEHDHDFDLAISLHKKSLNLFLESGFPTRESWADGVEHALEHLFMSHYDKAIQLYREQKHTESVEWFKKAFSNFLDYPAVFSKLARGYRVGDRLQTFYSQPTSVQLEIRNYLEQGQFLPVRSCKKLFL